MKVQIDDEIRDATDEEIARIEKLRSALSAQEAAFAASRNSAVSKLKALGLTDSEIDALVG